jgi:hypothetical protein
MKNENALLEHLAACEATYYLLLDENRLLKTTNAPPADDFLVQKRAALRQMDKTLTIIRAFRASVQALTPEQRAMIQKTQQIVLKALLLDRENEQLLLKCVVVSRQPVPQIRPTMDQLQRLYRKHGLTAEVSAE